METGVLFFNALINGPALLFKNVYYRPMGPQYTPLAHPFMTEANDVAAASWPFSPTNEKIIFFASEPIIQATPVVF